MDEPVEPVEALGEFGLIEAVTARLHQTARVLLGPGDDAAVLATPDGRVAASTDLLVEGNHFTRAWSTGYDVGRNAAARNLADVAAIGARPTALLVGVALPGGLEARWPLELADGLRDECDLVGAAVIGGDVVRGATIAVAVTALGDLEGRAPITRAGARPGDLVAIAGRLGHSAAGLALLQAGYERPRAAIEDHRRPRPPYEIALAATADISAMIDVSDGLLQDLGHVAAASGISIDVEARLLPADDVLAEAAKLIGVSPLAWQLTGGEDHAFAACFRTDPPAGWQVIGTVRPGAGVTVDGRPPPAPVGFDHFRTL